MPASHSFRRLMMNALTIATIGASAVAATIGRAEDVANAAPFAGHPAEAALEALFPTASSAAQPGDFHSSGITRADYLTLMAGDVDFFKAHQNEAGAIIDPYVHSEIQYSTPSFALAAGTLVKEAGRKDLLEPATRAMTCALTALVTHHAANQHSDFYIPLLVHAYEALKTEVPADVAAGWEAQFKSIVPEKTYRMDLRAMNWNIVSSCGELLRRKDGLVAPDQMDAQWKYLEESLQGHVKALSPLGLIEDPGAPMAYDAFSRMWLDEMMADGAYDGKLAATLDESLKNGALSALFLFSPSGEWANGGRSGMHNWTEAENLLIFEIEADRWKKMGRDDVAGAFKRAAHLGFESMKRWQRPTGELWIVKNRAEPDKRLGFEGYSFHTQYNLLPMAMLAMAYHHADDSIVERASPSEVGGYVFDARDRFHKVAAAAAGYYVLIDTAADPHYNATGLQRVHRSGVGFPALSDSAAAERAYGPGSAPKMAITPGIAWKNSSAPDAPWHSLADFAGGNGSLHIASVALRRGAAAPGKVAFDLDYTLAGPEEDGRHVVEHYTLTGDGVECVSELIAPTPPVAFRAQFPALVSDGAADTDVTLAPGTLTIKEHQCATTWALLGADASAAIELSGPRTVDHNGYVQRAVAPLHAASVRYRITLASNP